MSANPLVSVVIPAFNCAPFIGDTLESVYRQTYTNWEIVLIDDGSTDGTRSALMPHMHRIRYYYQNNKGTAAARNTGIRMAAGELIAFLDNDDLWCPEKLELQVRALEDHAQCGLVFTDGMEIDGSRILRHSLVPKQLQAWIDRYDDPNSSVMHGWLFNEFVTSNLISSATSVMVRKQCVDKIGGFDEGIAIADDYDLYLRLARLYPMAYLARCLYTWRYREESQSGPKEKRSVRWSKVMISVVEKYCPHVPPELNRQLRIRLSNLYWCVGWSEFNQNRFLDSRGMFFGVLRYKPFNVPALLYLLASYLSPSLIERIRHVKRLAKSIW